MNGHGRRGVLTTSTTPALPSWSANWRLSRARQHVRPMLRSCKRTPPLPHSPSLSHHEAEQHHWLVGSRSGSRSRRHGKEEQVVILTCSSSPERLASAKQNWRKSWWRVSVGRYEHPR